MRVLKGKDICTYMFVSHRPNCVVCLMFVHLCVMCVHQEFLLSLLEKLHAAMKESCSEDHSSGTSVIVIMNFKCQT